MTNIDFNVYTEACVRLATALAKANISFDFKGDKQFGGGYFLFPDSETLKGGDIACHFGTYGAEIGLFESYKMPWDGDDVTGWMATEDIIKHIHEVTA